MMMAQKETGGFAVGNVQVMDRDLLRTVLPPARTKTHVPIPHSMLVDGFIDSVSRENMEVTGEKHMVSEDSMSYLGLLFIKDPKFKDTEYQTMVGLRNDNAMRWGAEMLFGKHLFVCTNGMFSGSHRLGRRHTINIIRDLPGTIDTGVGMISGMRSHMDHRIESYKAHQMSDPEVHDFLVRSLDKRVICASRIPEVLAEFRNPRHPEFEKDGRSAWRLENAYTEIAKEANVMNLPRTTQVLTRLLDKEVGLSDLN